MDLAMATELRWRTSVSASCFHAVDALLQRRQLVDENLAAALAAPTATLHQALSERGISAASFMDHLVPLSATVDSNRELARTVLTKDRAGISLRNNNRGCFRHSKRVICWPSCSGGPLSTGW